MTDKQKASGLHIVVKLLHQLPFGLCIEVYHDIPAEDNMEFFTKRKVSFHKIKLSVDHFIPDSIDNDEFFTVNPSKVVQSPLRGQCIYLLT